MAFRRLLSNINIRDINPGTNHEVDLPAKAYKPKNSVVLSGGESLAINARAAVCVGP